MPYFEDLKLGAKYKTCGKTITDGMASILISVGGYAAEFFNNEEAANKTTALKWRTIPGRIAFMIMGGLVETYGVHTSEELSEGNIVNAGCREYRSLLPLRVGDTVHLESECVELAETSNPFWGKCIDRERLINQRGEVVIQADIVHLYERRDKTPKK